MYLQEEEGDSIKRLKVWQNLSPLQATFVENFNLSKIRTTFAFCQKVQKKKCLKRTENCQNKCFKDVIHHFNKRGLLFFVDVILQNGTNN